MKPKSSSAKRQTKKPRDSSASKAKPTPPPFNLYRHIKINIKNVPITCTDPINEQSFYCLDCFVSTCSKCTLDKHKEHNLVNKYKYYQFDKAIINEHFSQLDEILKNEAEFQCIEKCKNDYKVKIENEINEIINSLQVIKEEKMKEIDKFYEGSSVSMETLTHNEMIIKQKILDFFTEQKKFFHIDPHQDDGTQSKEIISNNCIIINEPNKEEQNGKTFSSSTNQDKTNTTFLLTYDLLTSTSNINNDIRAELETIKNSIESYKKDINNKITNIENGVNALKTKNKEKPNYKTLKEDYYKDIVDKVVKYSNQIKSIQNTVYDVLSKTGQYDDIEQTNFKYTLNNKQKIGNILNMSSNEDDNAGVIQTCPNQTSNHSKQSSTGKVDDRPKTARSSKQKAKGLKQSEDLTNQAMALTETKPNVVVNSPDEINLNNETMQKYFGYLTMDLVNKYYRPSKEIKPKNQYAVTEASPGKMNVNNNNTLTNNNEPEEDIEFAKAVSSTNEILLYDKKTRTMVKKKIPFDKGIHGHSSFLTGCRSKVIKDKVYITGGVDSDKNQSNIFYIYYAKTNELKKMENMPNPHAYHTMEYLHYYKSILVIGGENNTCCELFDLYTEKWTTLPDLNFPRANPSVYLDKFTNRIYCFFGIIGEFVNSNHLYSDIVEVIEVKRANLGWAKIEYKNRADLDFKSNLCNLFPLDEDKLLIYGASGVREFAKKAAIYSLSKKEFIKVDKKALNDMRQKAKKSTKLTKIISKYL